MTRGTLSAWVLGVLGWKGRGHLETRNQHVKEGGSKTRPVIPAVEATAGCVKFEANLGITKTQSGAVEARAWISGCCQALELRLLEGWMG